MKATMLLKPPRAFHLVVSEDIVHVHVHDHDRDCGSYAFHLLEKSDAGYHELGLRRSHFFPGGRGHRVHTVIVMIPE